MRFLFFFMAPPPTQIYTLSLHDALPISTPVSGSIMRESTLKVGRPKHRCLGRCIGLACKKAAVSLRPRSEEHTSELQSRGHLVCRLLLEKKKKTTRQRQRTKL